MIVFDLTARALQAGVVLWLGLKICMFLFVQLSVFNLERWRVCVGVGRFFPWFLVLVALAVVEQVAWLEWLWWS